MRALQCAFKIIFRAWIYLIYIQYSIYILRTSPTPRVKPCVRRFFIWSFFSTQISHIKRNALENIAHDVQTKQTVTVAIEIILEKIVFKYRLYVNAYMHARVKYIHQYNTGWLKKNNLKISYVSKKKKNIFIRRDLFFLVGKYYYNTFLNYFSKI